jgi:hypothetical protein
MIIYAQQMFEILQSLPWHVQRTAYVVETLLRLSEQLSDGVELLLASRQPAALNDDVIGKKRT